MTTENSEISRLEQANSLGLEYVRTIVLLNGGAILALLSFIGQSSTDAAIQFDLSSVKCAMWSFLLGIVSILFGLIISYSYTATAPGWSYKEFWDARIIKFNSFLGIASLLAFVFGVASLIFGAGVT